MFKEALDNYPLPPTLQTATITFFPRPRKDQQRRESYKPLSLLNSDYQVFSKLLAVRFENLIPKIIHADQSGFTKNRQGADNIRRLMHIIYENKLIGKG